MSTTTIKKQRMEHMIKLKTLGIVTKHAQNSALTELAALQAHNKMERQHLVGGIQEYNELAEGNEIDDLDDLLSINDIGPSEAQALQPSELQALQIVSGIAPLRALDPLGAARVEKMNLECAREVLGSLYDHIDPDPMGMIQDHYQDLYDLAMSTGYDDYLPPEPYRQHIVR